MTALTWGDEVRVRTDAGQSARPGSFASVCGLRTISSTDAASQHGVDVGTVLCLIEFEDGESIEVPETWLERVDD